MKKIVLAVTLMMGLSFAQMVGLSEAVEKNVSSVVLVVDGVSYNPTQVSGPVFHFETPDVNPTSAHTEGDRQQTGNGSDNLPCPGGIHWVSNANLLTVSHCLGTVETTVPVTTSPTTTQPPVTTTPGTTTPGTTTPGTTTTTQVVTTTTQPTERRLPETGSGDTVVILLIASFVLMTGLALRARSR